MYCLISQVETVIRIMFAAVVYGVLYIYQLFTNIEVYSVYKDNLSTNQELFKLVII